MSPSRLIHAASLCVIVLGCASTRLFLPDLWKDDVTAFSTLGGFVTLYGVIFAVIETWRARNASEQARTAAEAAGRRVAGLYELGGIARCQGCIHDALRDLEREGWASTSSLTRIIELYTAEFHESYEDPTTPQRQAIAALQSHAATAPGPLKGLALQRLKKTLVTMLADVTAAAGPKLSEKPQ